MKKSSYASGSEAERLGRQIDDYARLRLMREGLYAEADEIFGGLMERTCPDIASRPIYEIEKGKFPSTTIRCLKAMENSREFGVTATVDNLSRLTGSQIDSLLHVNGVGKKSLRRVADALKKYGVKMNLPQEWDVNAI